MRVKILKDDARLGVRKGEVYRAERYHMDPFGKVTLLEREPDGYDPCCNQYIDEIAYDMDGQWMRVEGNRYVPMEDTTDE